MGARGMSFLSLADKVVFRVKPIPSMHWGVFFVTTVLLATLAGSCGARAASLRVLYSFCSTKNSSGFCTDGAQPLGPLLFDSGNLYGTTYEGGANNAGTVFKVDGTAETVLYHFCGRTSCADGEFPTAGLVADSAGNLYGTTKAGGAHASGTVFRLTLHKSTGRWSETVLYSFCAESFCADGGNVLAGLINDRSGNFYGTTQSGGHGRYAAGGAVFKLFFDRAEGRWVEQVLYRFCSQPGCVGGSSPQAGLVVGDAGDLFGTTENGGRHNSGTVFKLAFDPTLRKWQETVLYSFCSVHNQTSPCLDGASPVANSSRIALAISSAPPCRAVSATPAMAPHSSSSSILRRGAGPSGTFTASAAPTRPRARTGSIRRRASSSTAPKTSMARRRAASAAPARPVPYHIGRHGVGVATLFLLRLAMRQRHRQWERPGG